MNCSSIVGLRQLLLLTHGTNSTDVSSLSTESLVAESARSLVLANALANNACPFRTLKIVRITPSVKRSWPPCRIQALTSPHAWDYGVRAVSWQKDGILAIQVCCKRT